METSQVPASASVSIDPRKDGRWTETGRARQRGGWSERQLKATNRSARRCVRSEAGSFVVLRTSSPGTTYLLLCVEGATSRLVEDVQERANGMHRGSESFAEYKRSRGVRTYRRRTLRVLHMHALNWCLTYKLLFLFVQEDTRGDRHVSRQTGRTAGVGNTWVTSRQRRTRTSTTRRKRMLCRRFCIHAVYGQQKTPGAAPPLYSVKTLRAEE